MAIPTSSDVNDDTMIGNLILPGIKKSRKSSSVKRLIPHFQSVKQLSGTLTASYVPAI